MGQFVGTSQDESTNPSDPTTELACPPGVVAGDRLVALVGVGQSTGSQITPPDGWTKLGGDYLASGSGANAHRGSLFTKIATGSEPATYTFTHDPGYSFGVLGAYRNVALAGFQLAGSGYIFEAPSVHSGGAAAFPDGPLPGGVAVQLSYCTRYAPGASTWNVASGTRRNAGDRYLHVDSQLTNASTPYTPPNHSHNDYFHAWAAATIVFRDVPFVPLASPLDIPNCILWVSSDDMLTKMAAGAGAAQWDDLSGFGHHLVASEPTVKPTLMGTGGQAGGPAMSFSEVTRNGFNVPSGVVSKVLAAGGTTIAATVRTGARGEEGMWGMQEAADKPQSHAPYAGRMYDGAMSSGRWDWAVSTSTWYRYKVFSNKNAGGNPNWSAWLDDAVVINQAAVAAGGYGLRADPVIGHSRGNGLTSGTTFGGRFGTVVMYDRSLTPAEHANLDAWLTANPSGGIAPITVPPLYLGSTKVDKLFLGSTDITTAYLGTTKL